MGKFSSILEKIFVVIMALITLFPFEIGRAHVVSKVFSVAKL